MVFCEYGHRNHFDFTKYLTLQWKMAVLDINRDFLPQHTPFRDISLNNHLALRALSKNLLFDGYPPGPIPLSRNIAYGVRYDCQYVLLRLRTGVGYMGRVFRLGYVDSRCCDIRSHLLWGAFHCVG